MIVSFFGNIVNMTSLNNAYKTDSFYEYSDVHNTNKLARHVNKTQRYKPYNAYKIKCNRKPCIKYASRSLADVLLEHRQLQTSVSSEDYYAWDFVEVVVEVLYANKCHESSTKQQVTCANQSSDNNQ